ncbi:hypothetical protein ABZV52_29885 [Streptomyces sp. NPDC004735]|uniref:hypothetical protein n=1 Tax=Streptomyces sp. NPDC004735 TaxID=3156654 RepID=UPI0033BBF9CA
MTVVATEAPATVEHERLVAQVALIACGVNSYPNKTQACESHRKKGEALLDIASAGVDALAAAICGTGHLRSCITCADKAAEIIRICAEAAVTTAVAALPRTAVVFDLEGGLIDVRRIHHLAADSSAFHSAMLACPPNREVVNAALRAHRDGQAVLVMTGSDRRLEQLVKVWLGRQGVPAALMLMRGRGDYRPSAVVKRERLVATRRQFAELTVWSADPSVNRVSEREGLRVQVLPDYWGDVQ